VTNKQNKNKKIGFIGQGWIGKNYADDFEKRGFDVVRYALEAPYNANKEKIKKCDIVFIAVPTPSTPEGFDSSILEEAIGLVGEGKTAVIKSTLLPGTTESIQEKNLGIFVMHSPEFLREASAAYDATHPDRNIVGYTEKSKEVAEDVLQILPKAKYRVSMPVKEAELIKYAGNVFLYWKVLFANMLYDVSKGLGADYELIKNAVIADPRIGKSHIDPVHSSGHVSDQGNVQTRGAGGHCFIKDFAAFSELYKEVVGDELGMRVLDALRDKNIDLLVKSDKDIELLRGVYGEKILPKS